MQWECQAITDPGKVRKLNEDSIYHSNEKQIWAVADGMGGHHRGDLASQTIVNYLDTYKPARHSGVVVEQITGLLQQANKDLIKIAESDDAGIIASTCAILTRTKHAIICSWVGDSRIYRFRDGALTRLTRDHSYESVLEDMKNRGENIENVLVDPQTLTRGVGAEAELLVEHCHFQADYGDRYLICTDGLYKEVTESELRQNYLALRTDEALLQKLHQSYLDGGARDNLGLILISVN